MSIEWKDAITKNCKLKQHADDTMIFSAQTNEKTLKNFEESIKKLIFFEIHRPTINADKTEVTTFCKKNLLTTLEKQRSWAVKACLNGNKFDHTSYLKIYQTILPIRF